MGQIPSTINASESLRLACDRLCVEDIALFEADANERSITHQLAAHLKEHFPEYDVDCEYNRSGVDPKQLKGYRAIVDPDDTNAVTVYPDIIIHKRKTKTNLIVIEAKKSGLSPEMDIKKLRLYKAQLGYRHAFMVIFNVGTIGATSARFTIKEVS